MKEISLFSKGDFRRRKWQKGPLRAPSQLSFRSSSPHRGAHSGHTCTRSDQLTRVRQSGALPACPQILWEHAAARLQITISPGGIFTCLCVSVCTCVCVGVQLQGNNRGKKGTLHPPALELIVFISVQPGGHAFLSACLEPLQSRFPTETTFILSPFNYNIWFIRCLYLTFKH